MKGKSKYKMCSQYACTQQLIEDLHFRRENYRIKGTAKAKAERPTETAPDGWLPSLLPGVDPSRSHDHGVWNWSGSEAWTPKAHAAEQEAQ
jgi:hypothetical protein